MKKKMVITDPSYILDDTTWDECCKKCQAYPDEEWSEHFHKAIQDALENFTKSPAFAAGTGYGDWSNCLWGPDIDGTGAFFADAGMVSVCEYTPEVAEALGDLTDKGGAAVFEAEGQVKVEFDYTEPDWTVVNIEDEAGNYWHTDVPYNPDEDEE